MHRTTMIRSNHPARTTLLALFIMSLFSIPAQHLTFASTYRCEDSSGLTVLTDSPAQLEHCTVLYDEPSLNDAGTTSHRQSTRQPMSLLTQPNAREPNDLAQEYPFIDEQKPSSQDEELEVVTIPVTSYGGSLLVTVQLNQTREAQLILDTGATMTVLSQDVALDLGLISSSKTQLTTVYTAGGPIQVNVSTIESIQAGTAQVHDVDVAIHDLPDGQKDIDGLLGMSFLNHFLVTLDTNQGVLHLQPRSYK